MKIQKIIIPAGTYYIGDPALILHENVWSKFHSSSDETLIQEHETHKFILVPLDSDGLQLDSDLCKYVIDSGSIAIIPKELSEVTIDTEFIRRKTFIKPVLFRYIPYEFMSIGSIFFEMGEGEDMDYEYESEVEGHTYWKEWAEE